MDKLLDSGRIVRASFVLANFGFVGSLVHILGGSQSLTGKVDHAVVTVFGWIVIVGLGLALQKALELGRDRFAAGTRPGPTRAAAVARRLNGRPALRRW